MSEVDSVEPNHHSAQAHGHSGESKPFRAPPGLELLAPESAEHPVSSGDGWLTIATAVSDPCEASDAVEPDGFQPPPGLDKKAKGEKTSDEGGRQTISLGSLILADRNELKSNSPIFCPLLTTKDAAVMMHQAGLSQQQPKTKLRAKAESYVPTATQSGNTYPFVPASTVKNMWQKWSSQSAGYWGQSGFYPETLDGVSSSDTTISNYSEYDYTSSYNSSDSW
jgi:hypothetical protein